jgi:hypothetical protein
MAADIIARARAAQRERNGIRVKVRMPDKLSDRARACAKEARVDKLGEWVCIACRRYAAGAFDGVATSEKTEVATRKESECLTVRAPAGMAAKDILRAVTLACDYCERNAIPSTPQPVKRYRIKK